jgi:hypothetical protein
METFFYNNTSVDTEMCCPKGKRGCQHFILLTLEKKIMGTEDGIQEVLMLKDFFNQ